MCRTEQVSRTGRLGPRTRIRVLIAATVLLAVARAVGAAGPDQAATRPGQGKGAGQTRIERPFDLASVERIGWGLVRSGLTWCERTPPADRVCWGGLVA